MRHSVPAFFSSRTRKKGGEIRRRLCFSTVVCCFFKVCPRHFEQHDFNDCSLHKDVYADHALRANVSKDYAG